MVQTVTGEIPPADLGFTQVHEHVFVDLYYRTINSQLLLNDPILAGAELQRYADAGGKSLVDQTVHGLNPEPEALRVVSEQVGINIIAGTGLYWEEFHPPWVAGMSESDLAKLMVAELTDGIAGTDVRAGLIGEIGTGHLAISESEERVLRAAARAQREVQVPIATHAPFSRIGLAQARVLESAGADMSKVLIGHVDTIRDVEYHDELVGTGVYVGYDTVGQLDKSTDEDRAIAIAEMIRRGHGERIVLSSDICKRGALHYYGGTGYDHLINNFLPILRDVGLDQAAVDMLTVDNPRRLFSKT